MTRQKKHIIWSNKELDFDAWKDCLQEDYPEITDDDVLYEMMFVKNDELIDDERINLDIQLDNPILVIGDLGLWNGRRQGYKEIDSGNIRDCLYADGDYVTWYINSNKDFCCNNSNHDGTSYYLYREWKDDVTETQKDNLREKLYYGQATSSDITRYTRKIGDRICDVYGW